MSGKGLLAVGVLSRSRCGTERRMSLLVLTHPQTRIFMPGPPGSRALDRPRRSSTRPSRISIAPCPYADACGVRPNTQRLSSRARSASGSLFTKVAAAAAMTRAGDGSKQNARQNALDACLVRRRAQGAVALRVAASRRVRVASAAREPAGRAAIERRADFRDSFTPSLSPAEPSSEGREMSPGGRCPCSYRGH